MMEAFAIGPGAFGPMAQSAGGGCVFNSGLGRGVSERMSLEKTIKSQAVDLATAKGEIVDVDPIGIYQLKVQKAQFKDKVTGQTRDELTLVSPDFDNEPISVWTDAGENGTGTKAEYQKIIDWAGELARTKGEATLIWVSPGEKTNNADAGFSPEHRVYVLRKDDEGNVTASSYQLTGEKTALAKMMTKLGYGKDGENKAVEDQHVILKDSASRISHKQVYDAYIDSLSKEELKDNKSFIQKFKEDALENADQKRLDKFRKNTRQFEKQLKENYKGDIESAIEAISQGVFAAIRTRAEGIPERIKPQFPYPGIKDVIMPQNIGRSDKDMAVFDDFQKRNRKDFSREGIPAQVREILQPISPAVIGLAGFLIDKIDATGAVRSDRGVTEQNGSVEHQPVLGNYKAAQPAEQKIPKEQIFWRQLASLMFSPGDGTDSAAAPQISGLPADAFMQVGNPDNLTPATPENYMQDSVWEQELSLSADRVMANPRFSGGEKADNFVLSFARRISSITPRNSPESSEEQGQAQFARKQEVVTAGFQRGIEIFSLVIKKDAEENEIISSEEKRRRRILEKETVSLAVELVAELVKNIGSQADTLKEIQTPGSRAEIAARLSFLFRVYEGKDTPEAAKSFIAALIYKQILLLKENKHEFLANPEIEKILTKFEQLMPFGGFMEEGFHRLLAAAIQFFPYLFKDLEGEEDIIIRLIHAVCYLSQSDIAADGFEKLLSLQSLRRTYVPSGSKSYRHKRKKTGKNGVLYRYFDQVIYRHSRYLSQVTDM